MARSSSNIFKYSSIQSSDEGIKVFRFSMAILAHEKFVRIGEGLTCASCEVVISGSLVHSSSYRNYRWGYFSSILAQTWPQNQSQSA